MSTETQMTKEEIINHYILPFFSLARKIEYSSFGSNGYRESYVTFPDMTEELYNIIIEQLKGCK